MPSSATNLYGNAGCPVSVVVIVVVLSQAASGGRVGGGPRMPAVTPVPDPLRPLHRDLDGDQHRTLPAMPVPYIAERERGYRAGTRMRAPELGGETGGLQPGAGLPLRRARGALGGGLGHGVLSLSGRASGWSVALAVLLQDGLDFL